MEPKQEPRTSASAGTRDDLAVHRPYFMRISRLTVDKLGVKLYDTVSAVVAELVANAFDADAERVTVHLPLATELARTVGGVVEEHGYVIAVVDNGHGMTPDEAIDHYLQVGRDRRRSSEDGPHSRGKRRAVMGRKGIGKLAPFGICRRIEVLSSGGLPTDRGYLTTHFIMDFDAILADTDEPVEFAPGPRDGQWVPESGTTIRLSRFLPKRVPDRDTFLRQLARRFAVASSDFEVAVQNAREPDSSPLLVTRLEIPKLEGTEVDVSTRPARFGDHELPLTGWLALSKVAYKNEEVAGVRIYTRGKLVAVTRDFEQPAGFTGEFTMRSYLIGEVHAEWLDLDDGEDLIRTDRQSILWDSDYGQALRTWGGEVTKEIAARSRRPQRDRKRGIFLEKSGIEQRAKDRYGKTEVVKAVVALAGQIGAFAAEDELADPAYVEDLSEVILAVGPHKALIESFQEFARAFAGETPSLDSLLDLFGKTRIAEMASYSQIAAERVRVLRELERLVMVDSDEAKLQRLIADAPWLIEPTWSILTRNQALRTFKATFERFWKKRTGGDIVLTVDSEVANKRPDFTLVATGRQLHFVEIKASGHAFDDVDCERLLPYADALDEFFGEHRELAREFPLGYQIDLIADGVSLGNPAHRRAFQGLLEKQQVVRRPWADFLHTAKVAHEAFLRISEETGKRGRV